MCLCTSEVQTDGSECGKGRVWKRPKTVHHSPGLCCWLEHAWNQRGRQCGFVFSLVYLCTVPGSQAHHLVAPASLPFPPHSSFVTGSFFFLNRVTLSMGTHSFLALHFCIPLIVQVPLHISTPLVRNFHSGQINMLPKNLCLKYITSKRERNQILFLDWQQSQSPQRAEPLPAQVPELQAGEGPGRC